MKMYFGFSSHTNRTLSEKEIERNALLSDLEQTKKALEIAYAGFDNVTEPDLIDCYIYECCIPKRGNPCCFPDRLSFHSGCFCHK